MIKHISSKENSVLRTARSLHQKKYRDQSGLFLAESPQLIEEAVQSGLDLAFVMIDEALLDQMYAQAGLRLQHNQGGQNSRQEKGGPLWWLDAVRCPVYAAPWQVLQGIFDADTPQGAAAAVYKPVYDKERILKRGKGSWLVLDRLQDPGNVGTMIRTAEAAGMAGVLALKGTVDIYAPKVVRSAAGSLYRLPVLFCDGPQEAVSALKDAGKSLAAALPDAAIAYYEASLTQDTAILIGNEARGLGGALRESADIQVRIPMAGRTESLNAAVAAAILMYETSRPKV